MSELRERMIADMRSQGLSASTQDVYLHGVKGLAAYYRRSPDRLDEKDVRRYLLYLRDERGVARGTYTPHQGGIRFLFAHTLERDWSLFLKKSPSAEEEAFTIRFIGRGSARHPLLRKKTDPQSRAAFDVCLRPAHQRSRKPRSHGHRWQERFGARHWQGQQERQVPLPEAVLNELRRLWKTHRHPRWLCPSKRRDGPITRISLWRTFHAAARQAGITRPVSPQFAQA